jgi:hypothetical protein
MNTFYMTKISNRLVAAVLVCLPCLAMAQQEVAPPPNPNESGPSLEVTLNFITDRMNEQGKLQFTVYVHDAVSGHDSTRNLTIENGKMKFDAAKCTVGKPPWEIKLKNVRDILVDPDLSHFVTMNPASLKITGSDRPSPILTVRYNGNKHSNSLFLFREPEMADRVAKALIHAVELCGGGKPDPF